MMDVATASRIGFRTAVKCELWRNMQKEDPKEESPGINTINIDYLPLTGTWVTTLLTSPRQERLGKFFHIIFRPPSGDSDFPEDEAPPPTEVK